MKSLQRLPLRILSVSLIVLLSAVFVVAQQTRGALARLDN